MKIETALSEIEEGLRISAPAGASSLPPRVRYLKVLLWLKNKICPKSEEILSKARREETILSTIIGDILLAHISGLALPIAAVARLIAVVGITRFCEDPAIILEQTDD